MAQEPKKRHSRQRQGKRRASISLEIPKTVPCQNCGNMNLAHTVCATCGYYKGVEVVAKKKTHTELPEAK